MTNEKANPKLTLEKAQDQFAAWRKTRKKRRPTPEKLWADRGQGQAIILVMQV